MSNISLSSQVVLQYLEKWNDLPTMTIAKMIYNSDDSILFDSLEHCRTIIRYYRGTIGQENRDKISTTKFIKNE